MQLSNQCDHILMVEDKKIENGTDAGCWSVFLEIEENFWLEREISKLNNFHIFLAMIFF